MKKSTKKKNEWHEVKKKEVKFSLCHQVKKNHVHLMKNSRKKNNKIDKIGISQMAPSSVSMSMSAFLMSRWILRNALEPLRQTSADLNNANEIRLLIYGIVLAYCSPFLIAISSANRLWSRNSYRLFFYISLIKMKIMASRCTDIVWNWQHFTQTSSCLSENMWNV